MNESNKIKEIPSSKHKRIVSTSTITEQTPKSKVKFNNKERLIVFICLSTMNILLNMDHGTIPAATKEIQNDLQINELILGSFGSLVYLGNLIGALFLTKIIDVFNRRVLTIGSILLNCLLMGVFINSTSITFLFTCRIVIGIMQSFITIYLPVWIDQFGQRKWKTIMLSIFNITSPLGVIFGYVLTMSVKMRFNWKVSYIIQMIILILLSISCLFTDSRLFSKNLFFSTSSNQTLNENEQEDSFFEEGIVEHKDSLLKKFFEIIKEKVYLTTCLSITTLLFISTAIIFWAPDFGLVILKADHDVVLGGFVVVSLSGPVLGIIIGGSLVQKYAGGYEGKHSITFSVVFAFLAFTCCLPFRFITTIYQFFTCLWAVLFFGGCVIPILQGIMISSLKNDLRASGNSVSNILQNALGFLPAPLVYGFIYERTKNSDPYAAMSITLYYSFVGIVFALLAMYYRNYSSKMKSDEVNFHIVNNESPIMNLSKIINTDQRGKDKSSKEVEIDIDVKEEITI